MKGRRLTEAQIAHRVRVAGRADLTRREQSKLIPMSYKSWLAMASSYSDKRVFGASNRDYWDARMGQRGVVCRVIQDRIPLVRIGGAPLRALGVAPGDAVRVRFERHSRTLIVERAS